MSQTQASLSQPTRRVWLQQSLEGHSALRTAQRRVAAGEPQSQPEAARPLAPSAAAHCHTTGHCSARLQLRFNQWLRIQCNWTRMQQTLRNKHHFKLPAYWHGYLPALARIELVPGRAAAHPHVIEYCAVHRAWRCGMQVRVTVGHYHESAVLSPTLSRSLFAPS